MLLLSCNLETVSSMGRPSSWGEIPWNFWSCARGIPLTRVGPVPRFWHCCVDQESPKCYEQNKFQKQADLLPPGILFAKCEPKPATPHLKAVEESGHDYRKIADRDGYPRRCGDRTGQPLRDSREARRRRRCRGLQGARHGARPAWWRSSTSAWKPWPTPGRWTTSRNASRGRRRSRLSFITTTS